MRLLINARNRSVAIEGDVIVAEGGTFDAVIDCPGADLHPGLINAHDHLHRNHYGRLGVGPYPNAYRWADDIQLRFHRRIARGRRMTRRRALLAGAWKNLFAGVTTVVHHDKWEPDFHRDFPIRVAPIPTADSLGMDERFEPPARGPFALHLAEGVDDVAAAESSEAYERGLLNEQLIAVHCVGIADGEVDRFTRSGAALAWCPTSNHFLFGRTASARMLDQCGDVLLGSDSRLTGAGDLLDEIRAARNCRLIDDTRVADAVGRTAARRLGLAEPSLEPGAKADVILLEEPLLQARSSHVALTVADGIPRVARPELARLLGALADHGRIMHHGRTARWTNQQGRITS